MAMALAKAVRRTVDNASNVCSYFLQIPRNRVDQPDPTEGAGKGLVPIFQSTSIRD